MSLRAHVAGFDSNGDGVVSAREARIKLRSLGLGRIGARLGARLVLSTLSGGRVDSARARPDGSGAFGADGAFDEGAFANLWAVVSARQHGLRASAQDFERFVLARTEPGSKGRVASLLEFGLLVEVCGGSVRESQLRSVYEGQIRPGLRVPANVSMARVLWRALKLRSAEKII